MNARDQVMAKVPQLAKAVVLGTSVPSVRPAESPYEVVGRHYKLPFPGYPYQVETIDELAYLIRSGFYLDMGTGKTYCATVSALYKLINGAEVVIVLMPPILITGWKRWLEKIPGVKSLAYRGTPAVRNSLDLTQPDFILMSYQIFKRDIDRIQQELGHAKLVLIADEATALKNPASENHRAFRDFSAGHDIMLLTGSPLSTPADAYAYCKLIAPTIYRSFRHFENIHVEERDFFGNITSWRNLDLLAENMKVNAVRLLKEDVLKDLPPVTYTPLYYDLAPAHEKLYNKLAEEQLLRFEDGTKIDATTVQALVHNLQQIVLNYAHFSGNPEDVAAGIEMLDEIMEELDGRKLLIFTNYQMTNRMLDEHTSRLYKGRTIYGGVTAVQQQKAVDEFINNPDCRTLTLQIQSGGFGLDGLQAVANDVLFLEFPSVPAWFYQASARLHRVGQMKNVNVRIAVAERTMQVRKFKDLMNNDALVNSVVRNVADLRDMILGTERAAAS